MRQHTITHLASQNRLARLQKELYRAVNILATRCVSKLFISDDEGPKLSHFGLLMRDFYYLESIPSNNLNYWKLQIAEPIGFRVSQESALLEKVKIGSYDQVSNFTFFVFTPDGIGDSVVTGVVLGGESLRLLLFVADGDGGELTYGGELAVLFRGMLSIKSTSFSLAFTVLLT